ncbi:V-set and immunoglobulin domain-containing protein 10 [Myripristis murdjan]|uniref:Ig-like domain-containing protein n=1 Tax=Myripristis murdjan TaxID=586833 RepID=A0A667Z155_9TELE|nr:V-set and immunoglobulin domain-containing protein 10 [Myripristis murdjan]
MKGVTTAALLHLCFHVTVAVSGERSATFTVAPGELVQLPCSTDGGVTPSFTRWTKNGRELISRNHTAGDPSASPGARLTVLANGSLNIQEVAAGDEGTYTCNATLQNNTIQSSVQLQVLIAPERHPECQWQPAEDPSHVWFNCSWFGAYPTPTLTWGENHHGQGTTLISHLYATNVTDYLEVKMNRSQLFDGQTMKCVAEHPALGSGGEKTCSLTLKMPFPDGEPLVTAMEATNVTLICSETSSLPPANTVWKRGIQQEDIVSGQKYVLSQEGPVFRLTIVNVSKDDEGAYFCRSENPLGVRELEVYLTVKTSNAYTGAIIGVFIAVLIVGSAVIIANLVYSNRHRVCLGNGFGQMQEDRGDVLSLVESDDEQIFQDAVPRLPPVTNGNHTTFVQIHRIPSSEQDDSETADPSPQQQEDTVQTEEPADLVTF